MAIASAPAARTDGNGPPPPTTAAESRVQLHAKMRILAGEITRGFDGLNDLVDETQRSFQLTEDLAEEKRTPVGERSMFYRNLPLGDPRRVAWDVGYENGNQTANRHIDGLSVCDVLNMLSSRVEGIADMINIMGQGESEGDCWRALRGLKPIVEHLASDLHYAGNIFHLGKIPMCFNGEITLKEEPGVIGRG